LREAVAGCLRAPDTKEEGSLGVSNIRSVNLGRCLEEREHLAKDTYIS